MGCRVIRPRLWADLLALLAQVTNLHRAGLPSWGKSGLFYRVGRLASALQQQLMG